MVTAKRKVAYLFRQQPKWTVAALVARTGHATNTIHRVLWELQAKKEESPEPRVGSGRRFCYFWLDEQRKAQP